MKKAIKKIGEMKDKTFKRSVGQYQREILMEWERMERNENRRRGRGGPGEDEDDYELRCIHCSRLACLASDVRKIQDSHHVVMDLDLLKVVSVEVHPQPTIFDHFKKVGKLFCKECHRNWGIQALYKGIRMQFIRISAYVVVNPDGTRDTCKKWKDVSFNVSGLMAGELHKYCDELLLAR